MISLKLLMKSLLFPLIKSSCSDYSLIYIDTLILSRSDADSEKNSDAHIEGIFRELTYLITYGCQS